MTLREDPVGRFFFALEVDGVELGYFLECSGLRTSAKVFEIEEGGLNGRVHRFVDHSTWQPVTLRYGMHASGPLQAWREACRSGEHGERRTGAILLKGPDGEVVQRYHLLDMWPVRWGGPELDAVSSEVAVEEVELAHGGIRTRL